MHKLFKKIRNNYKLIGTVLMFLVAFVLMSSMMPRERRFTYEFHKGKPWAYEDYTARFRFPIRKTDEELQIERDSALKDFKLYFTYDAYFYAEQLNKFKEDFDNEWAKYSLKHFNISTDESYRKEGRYKAQRDLEKKYSDLVNTLLKKVYYNGVIELPEIEEVDNEKINQVLVIRGNIAEDKDLTDLFTPKTAYEYIRSKMQEELAKDKKKPIGRYFQFFDTYEFEKFIKSNVFYDELSSSREKKSRIDEISLNKGGVQEGELIISKGEIVTQEKYQILESLKHEYEREQGNVGRQFVLIGKLLLLIIALVLIYMFLYSFRREVLKDLVKTSFILFIVVLMVFIATTMAKIAKDSFYLIPFAILPILLRAFYDERVAVFIHVITMLIIGFIAPNSYEFVFLNIMAGIVAIFSLTNLYRRSRFFISALLVFLTYSASYFGLSVVQEGSFSTIEWTKFMQFGLNGGFVLISFLLIYVFEKTFGFLSDTTLMELSDSNQPLLRKLAEIAPGTFQHSLQVANLSEEAVFKIGGNPLLVRTGALYHDIGKMFDPIYFIENQTTGINPHDNLEFEESSRIIIDHVQKGIELAKKNKLPEPIIEFIRTHHGTSTVQYFYRSYIKKYPEKDIDLKQFTYPGPRPIAKETAVLMMADSVEAASRSLENHSAESISELVERIINSQMDENQFEDADITFKDIKKVKEVFKSRLNTIYHARIAYPK